MRFRKKPIVIEAVQWHGKYTDGTEWPDWFRLAIDTGLLFTTPLTHPKLTVKTLEGYMEASVGDWIIQGVKKEIYPCKPDIFEATYEAVLAA